MEELKMYENCVDGIHFSIKIMWYTHLHRLLHIKFLFYVRVFRAEYPDLSAIHHQVLKLERSEDPLCFLLWILPALGGRRDFCPFDQIFYQPVSAAYFHPPTVVDPNCEQKENVHCARLVNSANKINEKTLISVQCEKLLNKLRFWKPSLK